MDDKSIINLYLSRDEAAIRQTAGKYGLRLRSLANGIVQDLPTAEECENDTYLEAWNSIPPHSPWDYLYAFLARITRHISINCCRKNNALKRSAQLCQLSDEMAQCIPGGEDIQQHLDENALKDAINRFLGSLSPVKRQVFLRRYWFLDTIDDISGRYGFTQSKVKAMLHRCRNQLQKYLEKEGFSV